LSVSSYYSPEDLGGMANYKLVNGAGKDLLKTRIDFIAGEGYWASDYLQSFLDRDRKINTLCGF
jgi:mannitol/fructose-specific phosphotransferase system IIA component